MTYIRVSLRGSLPGGENWSVNPCYNETSDDTNWSQSVGNEAAAAIAGIAPTNYLRGLAGAVAPLTSVRVEKRRDNHELLGAAEAAYTGGWTGAASATKPFQSSLVLSLRSTTPGGSGRGRLYWPALGAGLDAATLRLANPTPANIAAGAVSYLDAIETALKEKFHPAPSLNDFRLCIVSRATNTRHDVTRIEVGDILDVQRRRRDKSVESYAQATYP